MAIKNGTSQFFLYFNDEEEIVKWASYLTQNNVKIRDAYTPFPVHGLHNAMGIRWTKMGVVAFIYAVIAMVIAIIGCWYFTIYDWPMIIGGKPNHTFFDNLPSFVPVIFEFTVFCTAHFTVITMLIRSKILPGVTPPNPHPSTTVDKFALEIHASDNKHLSLERLISIINSVSCERISTAPERPDYIV